MQINQPPLPTESRIVNTPSADFTRRLFLASSTAAVAWPFLNMRNATAAERRLVTKDYPFKLGVASGDPAPDGVVLWTRLAPDPVNGGGMPQEDVQVHWQVAADEGMTKVVRKGVTTASKDWGHSVHVEVEGLRPDRTYYYQFKAAGEISPTGRTRTAPAKDAANNRFRFAFASCQHYETGYFTALNHIAQDDVHAVIHLGDYIYEYGPARNKPRQHNSAEIVSLDDYRNRYALYRTDPDLQAAHAAHPWIVTWDDHEFDNNYAGDISEEKGIDTTAFLRRRADAYKAYYEHMPLRRNALPRGPMMQLYRNVDFGSLVRFSVLDTRQYRTDQPCNDHNKPPCEGVSDPHATLLGAQQETWLNNSLKKSGRRWNVLAQQVMMARVDRTPGDAVAYSMDQWGGYEAGRSRLLQFFRDAKVSNPVVLTGDIHTNWVNDLKVNFDDEQAPLVGTEFVGTSITSGGDGAQTRKDTAGVLADNYFVKFYNAERGYVRCELTHSEWKTEFRVIPYVTRQGAPCKTRAAFVVENGRPGAQRV